MRDLFLITNALLKRTRTAPKKEGEKIPKSLIYKLLIGVITLPVLYFVYTNIHYLAQLASAQDCVMAGLTLISMFTVMFTIFYFPPAFYFSDDTKHLVVLPVKAYSITGAKLLEAFINHLKLSAFFALPMAAALFTANKLNVLQILLFLLCALIFVPMIILLVLGTITMILAKLFPKLMNKERFGMVTGLFTVVVAGSFSLFNTSSGGFFTSPGAVQSLTTHPLMKTVQTVFFQNSLAADAVANGNMISLLLLIAAFAGLCAVFMLLANAVYLPSVTSLQSVSTNRRQTKKTDFAASSYLKTSAIGEFMQTLRSPAYVTNILSTSFMLPIMMGGMFFLSSRNGHMIQNMRSLDLSALPVEAIAFLLGILIALMSGLCLSFCSSGITRKGKSGVKFALQIPQTMETQLNAILIPGVLVSIIPPVCVMITLNFLFVFPIWANLFFLAGTAVVCTLFNVFALLLDVLRPNLTWESETSAIKTGGNSWFALLGSVLVEFVLFAPLFFLFKPLTDSMGIYGALTLYAVVIGFIDVIATYALYKFMTENTRKWLLAAV